MADTIRLRVDIPKGLLSGYFNAREEDIARAATDAMAAVGNDALVAGKQNIAAAGFAANTWQRAWHLKLYPKGNKPSLGATAFLANVIPYSAVFEKSTAIRSKGLGKLWIPFSTTPKLKGNKKTTPANFAAAYGIKLRTAPFKTKSGKPILVAASGPFASPRLQPLFFGVDVVTTPKLFDLVNVSAKAADGFAERFAEAFAKL